MNIWRLVAFDGVIRDILSYLQVLDTEVMIDDLLCRTES